MLYRYFIILSLLFFSICSHSMPSIIHFIFINSSHGKKDCDKREMIRAHTVNAQFEPKHTVTFVLHCNKVQDDVYVMQNKSSKMFSVTWVMMDDYLHPIGNQVGMGYYVSWAFYQKTRLSPWLMRTVGSKIDRTKSMPRSDGFNKNGQRIYVITVDLASL